ncbi:hypothetical protein CDL12_28804 [Handroanthus impetiginosus]|uniref:Uncharacterized protein n=1 Tax=Handroanthus impetiginosus TaxID=429701 RepID=A0A2G9G0K4_9LAMI|nr:hypothetical protein CDL12_28804 [Handroanthus impetiginosus]
MCKTEEPEGLVGALKAKLFCKRSSRVNQAHSSYTAQFNSKLGCVLPSSNSTTSNPGTNPVKNHVQICNKNDMVISESISPVGSSSELAWSGEPQLAWSPQMNRVQDPDQNPSLNPDPNPSLVNPAKNCTWPALDLAYMCNPLGEVLALNTKTGENVQATAASSSWVPLPGLDGQYGYHESNNWVSGANVSWDSELHCVVPSVLG